MLKFTTGGKTYTTAALTRPSIRQYLNLARQTEELGDKFTSARVFALEAQIAACKTAKERTDHPDFLFFLAVIVWATLIEAGDPDPFDEAIDTRLDDLVFFYDGGEPVAKVDPSRPRAARVSARGAGRPAAAEPAARTSRTRSTRAS